MEKIVKDTKQIQLQQNLIKLICEYGLDNVNLELIKAELQIEEKTFYDNFANIESVVNSWFESVLILIDNIEVFLTSSYSSKDKILQLFRFSSLEEFTSYETKTMSLELWNLIFIKKNPYSKELSNIYKEKLSQVYENLLRRGVENKEFEISDIKATSLALISIRDGFWVQEVSQDYLDVQYNLENAVKIFLKGIEAK